MKRIILVWLVMSMALWATDAVRIIKNPAPTCVESNYQRLVKVKELQESEDAEDFLVKPWSLVVDDRGHVFVYDAAQSKIFQYDSDLKPVRTFGSRGQGPGEIGGGGHVFADLFIKGREIYFPDTYNRKIICFNTDGELVREIPIRERVSYMNAIVVDQTGNFYLHADNTPDNRNIVDCHNGSGVFIKGFLDRSDLLAGLFFKAETRTNKQIHIPQQYRPSWYFPSNPSNIMFSITKKDQLLILSSTSGILWVFNKERIQRRVKLWPKKALLDYRTKLENATRDGGFYSFFKGIFADQDDPDRFFLYYGYFEKKPKLYLYEFDLSGALKKVYYILNPKRSFISIRYKSNGKFYGISRNRFQNLTISVFKEGENE